MAVEHGGAPDRTPALFTRAELEGDDIIPVATGGNVDTDIFARALETYGTGD